jgi:hypothetical protein
VFDVQQQIKEVEALRQNEYFARRWWELEYLDYRRECELSLLAINDLVDRIARTDRVLIDIRSFE